MFRRLVAVLAALLPAALLATGGIATAAPASPPGIPGSTLVLSISRGQHALPVTDRTILSCRPSGGTHPRPSLACLQLASVHGDITSLNLHPARPCVLLYAPVTVTATGTWNGDPVLYRETFDNSCLLAASKGALFRF